jgi:hypothetical protein
MKLYITTINRGIVPCIGGGGLRTNRLGISPPSKVFYLIFVFLSIRQMISL